MSTTTTGRPTYRHCPMTDEQWHDWLFAPLSRADRFAIEMRESLRQWGFTLAAAVADQLMDETEARRVWDDVQAEVALRDLAYSR